MNFMSGRGAVASRASANNHAGAHRHSLCFRSYGVNSFPIRGHVIRADTPPRHGGQPDDAREVLWMLTRDDAAAIRAELVALTDAVELEMFASGRFRRRWRFLRDATARQYAARVRARLTARGFEDRRGAARTGAWPMR